MGLGKVTRGNRGVGKGERLGLLVTSSSHPEYEVHPNSFDPASTFDDAPVARQTIHLSAKHPSALVLPVVAAE